MARQKFTAPQSQAVNDHVDPEVPAGAPPIVERCEFLREIASGRIHPYSELMARRGDLVEAYDGPIPTEKDEVAHALGVRQLEKAGNKSARASAPQPPQPPVPPQPPKATRARRAKTAPEQAQHPLVDPLGPIIGAVKQHEAENATA